MILTHIDLKYVPLIYPKIHQRMPNGKGLSTYWTLTKKAVGRNDGTCPNLLRGHMVLILVPSDCDSGLF